MELVKNRSLPPALIGMEYILAACPAWFKTKIIGTAVTALSLY
jgi:hypothetical protein